MPSTENEIPDAAMEGVVMPKPKWLEPLEQAAHGLIGAIARALCLDLLWWARERHWQWPPGKPVLISAKRIPHYPEDRVIDMMTDVRSFLIGGTIVDVALRAFMIYLIVKVYA